MSVEEKVKDIIAQHFGIGAEKITRETHLEDDLGADSLDAIEIVMQLEDAYKERGLTISDEDAKISA